MFSSIFLLVLWAVVVWLVVKPFVRRPDGAGWLRRWGLERAATAAEGQVVSRRIRVQRGWSIAGFVLAGAVLTFVDSADGTPVPWVASLLVGLVLGELATTLGQRGRRVRTASLTPRPPTALVARWARWALRIGAGLVLVLLGVVELQSRWWAGAPDALVERAVLNNSSAGPTYGSWPAGATAVVVGTVVTVLAAELVVRLAVTRPTGAAVTEDVDLLLRARSARVATGAGLGLTGFLLAAALYWSHQRVETLRGATDLDRVVMVWANASGAGVVVAVLAGALAWIFAANPPARSVLSTVRRAPVAA